MNQVNYFHRICCASLFLALVCLFGATRPAHSITAGSPLATGNNSSGQLGNEHANYLQELVPLPVSGLGEGVTAVAAGGNRSLALANGGTVWQWGEGTSTILEDGTYIDGRSPLQVAGLSGITAVACGFYHRLVLKEDGTVWTWGSNDSGQLGDGSTNSTRVPVQVSGLSGATAICGGAEYSLAIGNGGTVWAWGNNGTGRLGDGTTITRTSPVQVLGLTDVVALAAGVAHSLALKSDGTVWAWGYNTYGQLGDGGRTNHYTPVQLSGLSGVIDIACGDSFSVALKNDGTVWTWGNGQFAHLGNTPVFYAGEDQYTPEQVNGLSGVVAIATGSDHTIVIKDDGSTWGWGLNMSGQLGTGTQSQGIVLPTQLYGLSGAREVASGWSHTLAISSLQAPPTAVDDTCRVLYNTSNNGLSVLANDRANGGNFRIAEVSQGSHGTVSISLSGLLPVYTPAAGYVGPDSFTYTVSNAYGQATATVNVDVNTPPTISDIADITIGQNSNTGAISFTVGDVGPLESLTLAGTSVDITYPADLVPAGNIVFSGSGADRTVTITPATGRYGKTTIKVTVSDGHLTASDTFVLTVLKAPVINFVSPGSGVVGDFVFISGQNFTPDSTFPNWTTTLTFNGTPATILSLANGSISTTVPVGATSGPVTVTTPGGTATSSTVFTVRPTFSVSGRIADAHGYAIAGVSVARDPWTAPAVTNGAGYYTLTGVPAGTYTLTATKSNYSFTPATRSITVGDANVGGQNFVGKTGINISGRVSTSTGAAIAGVTLSRGAAYPTVISNSAGYYTFIGVQLGSVTITAGKSGYRFVPDVKVVTAGSSDMSGINFIGATGYNLSGRIANTSGSGLAGISVKRTGSNLAVTTNSAGYYTFIDVPNGTHTITASGTGLSFSPETRTVEVNGADVSGQNFITAPGFNLIGRIMTSAGVAIPNVVVSRTGSNKTVFSNSSGYYVFSAVPNGTYTVTPQLAGYAFTPATKTVTVSGVDATGQNFIGVR